MSRAAGAIILLAMSQPAVAGTDFGIRTVGGKVRNDERMGFDKPKPADAPTPAARSVYAAAPSGQPAYLSASLGQSGIDMGAIKGIGAHWGRVTSTFRSFEHNRRVGGVSNSYHLRGRAIDIARRPGVSHWQIAAAYRSAGYNLLESLDEGDHSHFAFGRPGESKYRASRPQIVIAKAGEVTEWRVVYAPSGGGN
jgi:hypothetical protein